MPDDVKGMVDESVRERLLNAALDLFSSKGYAATTVREIVDAAGVTKPVLYYYFGSKEQIFLEIMKEPFERYMADLAAARSREGSALEKISRACREAYQLFLDNIRIVRVMYAVYYGPQHGAPPFDFDAIHRSFQELLEHCAREGVAAGEIDDDIAEEFVWAVVGAINIAMEMELCHPDRPIGFDGLERTLKVIYRGARCARTAVGRE